MGLYIHVCVCVCGCLVVSSVYTVLLHLSLSLLLRLSSLHPSPNTLESKGKKKTRRRTLPISHALQSQSPNTPSVHFVGVACANSYATTRSTYLIDDCDDTDQVQATSYTLWPLLTCSCSCLSLSLLPLRVGYMVPRARGARSMPWYG